MQNNIFSGLFVGQNLITIQHVDSTNNYLKNLLSNSTPVPEGTVIMAESQYAGRGQQQNKWYSEPGKNLTFSIFLKPAFLPVVQQFDLTRTAGLGVFDALEPFLGEKLKIKWPNDIYYGDQKLGGMLIENTLQGGKLKNSIVGIGLNVNQEVFPPGAANAVSLKQILHSDYDLKFILSEICKNIEANYLGLRSGRYDAIREAYLRRLYRLNEEKLYRVNGQVFEGMLTGVTDEGLLRVNVGHEEKKFSLKEIEFLNN
ncbi:MAG: biotin--[acetyl-CoA-carboxylase] ligase [Bacteroidetes bacterium]|nr:biotin--[acetyl-CoA-carboxylase] ligase [Bacteroidota bacterium]